MEEQTIHQAQMGDQLAFQRLIEAYHTIAWRTARVFLPDAATAEDVLQEAWLDVWRSLPRFQRGREFRPWLLTIVANRCRVVLRRRKLPTLALDGSGLEQAMQADDVLEQILHLENDIELQLALEMLSAEQQRVLELRFFAGLDLAEIAQITNAPLGTVKSRLHRALASLRTHLQPVGESHKETNRWQR
ncbi:MAG TPA: RNA polymerase sigma factor [Ktedonobacteraceae bacterium]|jgi:RNA polymerase sigma-70 factor (ECF subfamily)|nr:RNA polymerase sigma factor [Ktedonobacteraceae bacterium]